MKWAGSGLNVAPHVIIKWTDAITCLLQEEETRVRGANRGSRVVEAHTVSMGHSITSRSVSHTHARPPQEHCSERAPLESGGTKSHFAFKNSPDCFSVLSYWDILVHPRRLSLSQL